MAPGVQGERWRRPRPHPYKREDSARFRAESRGIDREQASVGLFDRLSGDAGRAGFRDLATIAPELLGNFDCPSRIQNLDIPLVEIVSPRNPLPAAQACEAVDQEAHVSHGLVRKPRTAAAELTLERGCGASDSAPASAIGRAWAGGRGGRANGESS